MKRLAILTALSLSGCAAIPALLGGMAAAPPPSAVADKTTLDETVGLAVEALYTAVARAGALAFRADIVQPSSNPAVQTDDFCALVIAKVFEPTDRGSAVMAMECKLRAARDITRRAYEARNAATYTQAGREAIALGKETLALIRGD